MQEAYFYDNDGVGSVNRNITCMFYMQYILSLCVYIYRGKVMGTVISV